VGTNAGKSYSAILLMSGLSKVYCSVFVFILFCFAASVVVVVIFLVAVYLFIDF
jgi:hypothetical protein